MKRNIILFITVIILILSIVSCTKSNLYNQNRLDTLANRIKNNEDIPLERISLGFDSNGNIIAWIYPKEPSDIEMKTYNITNYKYYDVYVAKRLMESYEEINSVWIVASGEISAYFMNLSRDTFEKELKDLPSDKKEFFNSDKNLIDLVNILHYEEIGDLSFDPIVTSFNNLYGERFKDFTFIPISSSTAYFEAKISLNSTPENMNKKLKSELAKAFVISIGRYENRYWDKIEETDIIYEDEGKQVFKISMTQGNYLDWKKSGLNPNELFNYSKIELFNPSVEPLFSEMVEIDFTYQHNTIENINYEQTMEELKKIHGTGVELLTNDDVNSRIVMLRLSSIEDIDKIYKKEMEITHEIMKLPIDTIWFFNENREAYRFLKIDRNRYNLLLYMNSQDKFDFLPSEWPIMASSFWEIDKTSK